MIEYILERRSKLGEWRKYYDFTNLDSLDILINEISSQNYLLKYDYYRVIETISISTIIKRGKI